MHLERYSKILHVRDFARQIDQSIRTYFCGYTFNAVTGLLPVIEGIIRKVATSQNRDVGNGTKGLNVELQVFVDREIQSQHCYGERLVMLEAFRDFVRDRLLDVECQSTPESLELAAVYRNLCSFHIAADR
jgi:hypothetical protein